MAHYDAVFEGGGAKGIAFVGALEVLKQQGHTIRRCIGTSAGAITATLIAAGFTPDEIMPIIDERLPDGSPRFSSFMDIPKAENFTQTIRDNSMIMTALKEVDLPLVPGPFEDRLREELVDRLLHNSIFARLFSFTECGGYYSGETFLAWIREKLALKGIGPTDTLATFAEKTGSDL